MKSVPHILIHYVLNNSKLTRVEVAKALGVSRKTIFDWEYQRTAYRDYMLDEVLKAANYSFDKIPAHIKQRALDADIARSKVTLKSKPTTPHQPNQTGIDPLERISAKGSTLEERIARRQPTDNPLILARRVKEDAIIAARTAPNPNLTPHGSHAKLPTTAKRGCRVGEISCLGDARNIPFPDDYVQPAGDPRIPDKYINLVNFPDLVYEARQTMRPYEVRFVPRHKIPYHGETGIMLRPAAWYTINTSGKMRSAPSQAEAKALAEQLRIEDDKAIAEFM